MRLLRQRASAWETDGDDMQRSLTRGGFPRATRLNIAVPLRAIKQLTRRGPDAGAAAAQASPVVRPVRVARRAADVSPPVLHPAGIQEPADLRPPLAGLQYSP